MKKIGLMLLIIAALVMSSTGLSGHAQDSAPSCNLGPNQSSTNRGSVENPSIVSAPAASDAVINADATDGQLAAQCVGKRITHSLRQTITFLNSIACYNSAENRTVDNSYWRAFSMPAFGFGTSTFTVSAVQIGVEEADTTAGSQTITLRLYTNSGGAFPAGTRTQIATQNFSVADTVGTIVTLNLTTPVVVPAGSELVVEIFSAGFPAGQTNNIFFIGSNNQGQTGPGYLSSAGCGIANPTNLNGIAPPAGPNMHMVMNVLGCTSRVRPSDFDLDSRSDVSVVRPNSDGMGHLTWYILNSSGGTDSQLFGDDTDTIVPGDYNGDLRADIAVFRPSEGKWYISKGSAQNYDVFNWGTAGDIPVPGDYDFDGKTDLAVFRPSNATWYIQNSSNGSTTTQPWGLATDKPVVGDYDGDGRADVAVWRESNGTWYVLRSSTGTALSRVWGTTGDRPAQGDYDQDGKTDLAVFRPSTGTWYIFRSFDSTTFAPSWGSSTDIEVPADYDLDGRHDVAVFRPSTGEWFILQSSTGTPLGVNWGVSGDRPTPRAYIPAP